MILVGQGVLLSNAEKELIEFSEKSGIPIASTLLGLGAVSCNHKNYVGYLGMHGNYGPNVKTNECDLIIAIGMRFDDRVTGDTSKYAINAKVIHIEIDPSEIPTDIQVMINNDEKALALLRIAEIIGEDKLERMDEDTMYFIISTLNQLKIDRIRNRILLKVLPLKV